MSKKSVRRNCSGETLTETGEVRPGLAVETGLLHHPGAEFDDQSAVLGDGDEFAGRNFAARRVGPAAERLDADHDLATLVDDRLIKQPKLIILDRLAQVAFQQLAVGQICIHRRVINAGAVAALILGAVERHVGVAHDVGAAAAIAVDHRDADRGADHDVLLVDRIGSANRGDNALRDGHHLGGVGADLGNDRELVAAEPRHQIVAA